MFVLQGAEMDSGRWTQGEDTQNQWKKQYIEREREREREFLTETLQKNNVSESTIQTMRFALFRCWETHQPPPKAACRSDSAGFEFI